MPATKYEVRKRGEEFCVFDKGSDSPIREGKGSCHATRADAVKQLRGIYANSGKTFSEKSMYVPTKSFSATLAEVKDGELPWIQIFPFGHWSHPVYGEDAAVVNYETAAQYVKNFNDNVRRQEIAIDYEHGEDKAKGSKASGWYRGMELRDDGVYAQIEFTENAKQEIANKEWKYFSPLFVDVYEDAETNEMFENVIIGGGLTNRPWMKDMVPVNFSEAVLEEETTKYRYKDSKWIASDNDGESWRAATTDEVSELEHSEPGTGVPPAPRLDEDDKSGDKDGSGSRRDSPPDQNNSKEGSDMKLEEATLTKLGVAADADEETVNAAIVKLADDMAPLKKFHEDNRKAKAFSEEFPEEAKEMERLRNAEDDRKAKSFSERYERIVTVEGEGDAAVRKNTAKGFSSLVLVSIEKLAKKFGEGAVKIGDVEEVLDLIATDKAIVDYGETGSSRVREDADGDGSDVAKAFGEKAIEIMDKANKEKPDAMGWGDAIAEAARQYPDLYKEYVDRPIPNA